jgi:hypothetical protein
MSKPVPIVIEAQAVPSENQGLIAAAEMLSECLGAAVGRAAWPVRLEVNAPGAGVAQSPPGVLIVSLLHEVERPDEPIAETQRRWDAALQPHLAQGAPIFLRTIFRHIGEAPGDGRPSPMLERIRRLNRMIVGLSHAHGVGVIDIDRACAHIGGRALQTDWQLGGMLAAEVAGHTTVWSLLSQGLDDLIDPEHQERAKANLGALNQIVPLIERRMKRSQARQAAGA